MSFKSYPSENLTTVHLGLPIFMHGHFSENLTVPHLDFSNSIHGSVSENLTPVNLGFQILFYFMHFMSSFA